MKKAKKILATILTCAFCLTLFSSCTPKNNKDPNDQSSNVVNSQEEKLTSLKIMAGQFVPFHVDWSEMLMWKEYEKRSGVHVEWEMVPVDALQEKRNLKIVSNQLPDAFMSCRFTDAEIFKYGKDGTFIDMMPITNTENAPNLAKIFNDSKAAKKGSLDADGKMLSLPWIFDKEDKVGMIGSRLYIRKDWLQKLNLELPSDLDGLYNMLLAFRDKDPNGNGKNDELPYSDFGGESITGILYGAFGLGNRGVYNPVDYDEQNKCVRYPAADPKYKEMLEYCNKLWKEKLIDNNVYTLDRAKFIAMATQKDRVVGCIIGGAGPNAYNIGDEYTGSLVLKGPHGDQSWSQFYPEVVGKGGFVITKSNKMPKQTLKWYDYFYGYEGALLWHLGVEGVTFEKKADGELDFLPVIKNNPDGLTLDQAASKYMVWPGGGHAVKKFPGLFKGGDAQPSGLDACEKIFPYLPKADAWPAFAFTTEESEKLATLAADIETYVGECRANFITGKMPFSEWDNYIKTLDKMGLKEYIKMYQKAYDRFMAD